MSRHIEVGSSREAKKCYFCQNEAAGPMFTMAGEIAHVRCVIHKLNELLDPDYEQEPGMTLLKETIRFAQREATAMRKCRECGASIRTDWPECPQCNSKIRCECGSQE